MTSSLSPPPPPPVPAPCHQLSTLERDPPVSNDNDVICERYLNHMPARREDFTSVTRSSTFPPKYCGQRWMENLTVMMKFKECLPSLRTYIKAVRDKKITDPASKPYNAVKSIIEDPLAQMTLAFAIAMCKPVEKFLTLH